MKKSLAAALCLSLLLSGGTCLARSQVYTEVEFRDALSNASTLSVFLKSGQDSYERYLYADGLGDSLDNIFTGAPTGRVVHYYTSNRNTYNRMVSYVDDLQENGRALDGYYVVGGGSGSYVDDYGNTIYDLWISRLPWERYDRFRNNYYNGAIGVAISILWPEDHYWYRYSHARRNYWHPDRRYNNDRHPAPPPRDNHNWNRRSGDNRPEDNRTWNHQSGDNHPPVV